MATSLISGARRWTGKQDSFGHRTYKVRWVVQADPSDGPNNVMQTVGIPVPGTLWDFGAEFDLWAFAYPELSANPQVSSEGDPTGIWFVDQKFSTKPLEWEQDSIENPLLTPQRVSGNFVKYSKEATEDRFGDLIQSSSFELFTGPLVEFDETRPTVRVEQNVADLELPLLSAFANKVNDDVLWGLAKRKVKLSAIGWIKKFHVSGAVYYTRTFDFDINFDTFDVDIPDVGSKVLNGTWYDSAYIDWITIPIAPGVPANKDDPSHFIQATDRQGNPVDSILLDGSGEPLVPDPLGTGTGPLEPVLIHVEKYDEANLLLLGIPTTL